MNHTVHTGSMHTIPDTLLGQKGLHVLEGLLVVDVGDEAVRPPSQQGLIQLVHGSTNSLAPLL